MNIFVASLPFSADDQDLRELFESYGEVTSAKVIFDRDRNRSKGFGFVEMSDDEAGNSAIAELHESDFQGRSIVVKVAESRPNQNRERRY
jgi:RNA recognition motif-containing protein